MKKSFFQANKKIFKAKKKNFRQKKKFKAMPENSVSDNEKSSKHPFGFINQIIIVIKYKIII